MTRLPGALDALFRPRGIAVIGASGNSEKLGYAFLRNLLNGGFAGLVVPVNPSAARIQGLDCVAEVADLPDGIDLAVVILPADRVLPVLAAVARRGIGAAMIPAGGFAETGEAGVGLQQAIAALCARTGLRVLGPNVPGFLDSGGRLAAAFAGGRLGGGRLAILSQAGSVGYLLLRSGAAAAVPFGRMVCVGNQVDVSDTEVLQDFAADPAVSGICMYTESIKDGRRFVAAARAITGTKPIVALKGGRTAVGQQAIFSHTASLSSPERVYAAAFRRAGVVEVRDLRTAVLLSHALSHQVPASGRRVAIVTSLAGVGVVATDHCHDHSLSVAAASPQLQAGLRRIVPAMGSVQNPIDLTGDVSPKMLADCVALLAQSSEFDGIMPLVMGVPGSDTFGNQAYAEALLPALEAARRAGKVVAVAWVMDEVEGVEIHGVRALLHPSGFTVATMPEDAAAVMAGLVARGRLRPGDETPPSLTEGWRSVLDAAAAQGRAVLTEHDSKAVLAAAGLPVVASHLARDAREAVAAARRIGFPVVLKIQSIEAVHKTDIGGVLLNLADEAAVERGFASLLARFRAAMPGASIQGVSVQRMMPRGHELLCGVTEDPQFGKLATIAVGGIAVELLDDSATELLPLTPATAGDMLGRLRAAPMLRGHRGAEAANYPELLQVLAGITALGGAPEIAELEVNPLLVTAEGLWALDARIRLHPAAGRPSVEPVPAASIPATDRGTAGLP